VPDHAPTRRDRRLGRAADPIPPVPPGSDWKPARRGSRLPAWIPPPVRSAIRIGFRLGVAAFCAALGLALFYLVLALQYDLSEIRRMPERSIVRDLRGRELGALHGDSRRLISRLEIPPFFVSALRAREDKRFYQHMGVDYLGLARATLRNLQDLSFSQGASTLTMQLARNTFDLRGKNLHRKLLEIALATRIEWEYTKDQILTAYVNRIYFGSGCHGLDEAARRYFGTDAAGLSPNQCALLAGIIRAPHAFSPLRSPERAMAQRNQVLDRMIAEGFLTPAAAAQIRSDELGIADHYDFHRGSPALHAVRRHLEELLAGEDIRHGGLEFLSTIHDTIQTLLESELRALRQNLGAGIETAGLCINNRTGGVRAIVGGSPPGSDFNRALDAHRDLGELLTPFLYAAAAERGKSPRLDQPVRTGRQLDRDDLLRLLARLGFQGPFGEGDDLLRGALVTTPMELATAVSTLANGGNRPRTRFIRAILSSQGRPLYASQPAASPALSRRAAAAALAMQFPDGEPRLLVALSPARTDLWAVSCGARHTLCLWAGHDSPQPLEDPDAALALGNETIARLVRSLRP